jgi:hypothetical protein
MVLGINAADLRRHDQSCISLHRLILRYAYEFPQQTIMTALPNGRSKIEERLARWLLMATTAIVCPSRKSILA